MDKIIDYIFEFIKRNPVVLFLMIVLLVIAYVYLIAIPRADKALIEVEKEFELISPFPEAEVVRGGSSRKASRGFLYITKVDADTIFEYYDEELTKHGWKYYKQERIVENYGKADYGGKSVCYKKGQLHAIIDHYGIGHSHNFTYEFYIRWRGGCS